MSRPIFFIFVFQLISGAIIAQSVTGKVVDEEAQPIPFCNVAAFSAADSSLVKGTTTQPNGTFSLSLPEGNYYVNVSFVSYAPQFLPLTLSGNKEIDIGTITLQPNSEVLDEVVIEGEKSTMELKLDKRVFNVEKDLANVGCNAAEILNNVPSVEVDVEGNVSLRGSGNVRILIDGRQSGLVGTGDGDALSQLSGDLIEKIEVITNPSARYDAEGEVGIINIVLKKDQKKGVNGSVTARAGFPHNYGLSGNINWRRKKVNFFLSTGLNFRQRPGQGYSIQEFTEPDTVYSFERIREHYRGGLSENVRGGVDFLINEKNTVTTSLMYSYSRGNNFAKTTYNDFQGLSDNLLQSIVREDDELEIEHTVEYSLNYEHLFEEGNKDHKLLVDARYIYSDDQESSDITEGDIELPEPQIIQRVDNKEFEENFVGQIDYIYPFAEEGKLELGAKTSIRNFNNDFLVEELVDGSWEPVEPFNNNFLYEENIHAAYAMIGNQINSFSFQLGLRGEYSDISTTLVETDEFNPREYFNLFPSAHFSYEIVENNSVQLSYSRRINRPRFWSLIPFFGYSDSRNFRSGNPNLNPEFTDAFELAYLKYFETGNLFSSVYYRSGYNIIQRITDVDEETGMILRFPINTGTQEAYGVEFTFSKRFWEDLTINGNANFYREITKGEYQGQNLYADAQTMRTRTTAKYDFNKRTAAQLSFNYRAPQQTIQGRQDAIAHMDLSASQDLFNEKATLTFSIRDVFNSRIRRWETFDTDFYQYSEFQWRARQFLFNFTYRINQRKKPERDGDFGDGGDVG